MEDSFFSVEARGSSGPSICSHALDVLRSFFNGTPHSSLFGDFASMVYSIEPYQSSTFHVQGGKIANAVGYILDKLNLLQHDVPKHVQRALDVYKDMFIPLMTFLLRDSSDGALLTDYGSGAPIEKLIPTCAYTVDSLPHCAHLMMQCSFWTDAKMSPLVHILTKCTPQRCQIRSLAGIIYNYSRLHDDVYTFIRSVAKASLLGIYDGCYRPPIEIRREIVERLTVDSRRFWTGCAASTNSSVFRGQGVHRVRDVDDRRCILYCGAFTNGTSSSPSCRGLWTP